MSRVIFESRLRDNTVYKRPILVTTSVANYSFKGRYWTNCKFELPSGLKVELLNEYSNSVADALDYHDSLVEKVKNFFDI